ncbi:MAG: hypothetical protein VX777_05365 [Chlamydiota bacterium]|nr:hypothetical protein [Chlamydiota bacterium]
MGLPIPGLVTLPTPLLKNDNDASQNTKHYKLLKRPRPSYFEDTTKTKKPRFNNKAPIKSPQICPKYDGLIAIGKTITINGQNFDIEELGEGAHHKVYQFTGEQKLAIDNKVIDLSKTVLKISNPKRTDRQKHDDQWNSLEAHKYLEALEVPQPEVYIRPDTFVDTDVKMQNKSGGFWIVEKMEGEAEITNTQVKTFVKKWLTDAANQNKEIIGDLKPDNVMLKNGNCYIIDPSKPQKTKNRFTNELFLTLNRWTKHLENDIKTEIFNELIADFPVELKEEINNLA